MKVSNAHLLRAIGVIALGAAACASNSNDNGADAGPDGSDARADTTPTCALGATYTFTTSHGLNPRTETVTLAPPTAFSYQAHIPGADAGNGSCAPALPACGAAGALDVADLEADIAQPDVQQALAQATPPRYGPSNLADANTLGFVRADGRGFSLNGTDCAPASATCVVTPPGAHQLLTDLQALVTQQLMDPSCAALR